MSALGILLGVLAIGAAYVLVLALGAYFESRRPQFITCPHNRKTVVVRVDPRRALRVMFRGERQRVIDCSRWPEQAGCDRECEKDIGA